MDNCYEMAYSIPLWWAVLILAIGVIGSYCTGWIKGNDEGKKK